jgi:tripartite-type tricarboxylate transporter receptor subunit TctC
MDLPRRRLLWLMASAALAPVVPKFARAQRYPSGPIRLIVGFAAGNAPDMVARLVGDRLSERLGQSVIVENRVGAASAIAAQTVASASPDGHTLLQITPANAINPDLSGGLNFVRDIAPVASVARGPMVMVVAPSFPASTLPEFIRYARENPDNLIVGSSSTGSTPYLALALFKMMVHTDLLHVPFRGTSQAISELLGGRVQLVLADMSAMGPIQSGTLRPLAVTSPAPPGMLPGVPIVSEFVAGYEASTWYGIGAPRSTPVEIIQKLNEQINAALMDAQVQARLTSLGFRLETGSPADFGKLIIEETEKWARVTKFIETKG